MDEFFDSHSLLGSLQEAFSSALSASAYASAGPGASGWGSAPGSWAGGGGGGAAGPGGSELGGIFALHDLAASIREVRRPRGRLQRGRRAALCAIWWTICQPCHKAPPPKTPLQAGAARQKRWSGVLTAPALALTLLYPEEAGGGGGQCFAPRLVAEAQHLSLAAEGGEGGGGGSLCATVGVLEVAEHLPFPASPSPASSAASCAAAWAGGWVPAEQMARVPAVLPAAHHIRWAAPTFAGKPGCVRWLAGWLLVGSGRGLCGPLLGVMFHTMVAPNMRCCPVAAGDYPLPDDPASLGGIGGTLAQLSDLSQATVYQSAAAALEVGAHRGWAA